MAWALKALDKVRVRTMTNAGISDRHAMWATRKDPAGLTGEQRTSLAGIASPTRPSIARICSKSASVHNYPAAPHEIGPMETSVDPNIPDRCRGRSRQ